jgi:hypothetical protein
MFFQGERGKYIGFYALALTNGVCFPPFHILSHPTQLTRLTC